MASVINTNLASLNAQRYLNTSQNSLTTSLQRLSSGLRINSAKDDAAGLAISERFSTQIRGLNVAARNANDGISLAQSAEGAMTEIGNNLQRIRELAVQSRNATNSPSDREALNAEAKQLKAEIDRVASTTSFNNTKLLNGEFTQQTFQVGANQGETITIDGIVDASSAKLGSWTGLDTPAAAVSGSAPAGTGGTPAVTVAEADHVLGGFTAGVGGAAGDTYTATFTAGSSTMSFTLTGSTPSAGDLKTALTSLGFDATTGAGTHASGFSLDLNGGTDLADAIADGTLKVVRADGQDFTYADATNAGNTYSQAPSLSGIATDGTTSNGTEAADAVAGTYGALTADKFTINGKNIEVTAGATSADAQLDKLITAINAKTSETFVKAEKVSGALKLSSTGGTGNIDIGGTGTGSGASTVANETGLTIGDHKATKGTVTTGFASLDISTATGADNAILAMDGALTAINTARANMGAVQNRFSSVVASVTSTSENLAASRSRILDTDFASETANLTRGQILQQAGTAMLAQANSLPNGVLALLRG